MSAASTEVADATSVRFYFSFRSPYAWLATEQLEEVLGDLPVTIERVPIYPTPGSFPNDPSALPDKLAYIVQDVLRLARERGLPVRFPAALDPDWSRPHAAFVAAERAGAGHRFMLEIFHRRFCEGRDVGADDAIALSAERAGLDAGEILEAAGSGSLQREVAAGWRRAGERDHVFGVPSFVHAGKLYWGQDRMRFLRSAILRKSGASAA